MSFGWILDLSDLMTAHYGSWSSATDIAPAMVDGLSQLRMAYGRGVIMIPPGQWSMLSQVPGDTLAGHTIIGAGSQASVIRMGRSAGATFMFTGAGGYTGGGLRGLGIVLDPGLGMTNAYAVVLEGTAAHQPDQMMFSDLYITTQPGSWWWEGFHVDGTARQSPLGVRIANLANIQIFSCHNVGAYFAATVGFAMTNLGLFTPAPGTTGGNLVFANGSTDITVIRPDINGSVIIDQSCSKVNIGP